ncbi:hypothetical protein HMPREF0083_02077 [Aneurinibacillus aneurinilyticus ATCC 12856]|jgi:hypothetical protein|uniref:Uncharacterized protein n=1 Tax=Aneurinibacillus aneurinilyticus ATCC 12856 TaxID=649747 RepID=U1WML1_ANEAE|nr:hypothetical protein HMPREF0083_02077 [Aneurinibacillus aneurinilyticus ATCC 12856]
MINLLYVSLHVDNCVFFEIRGLAFRSNIAEQAASKKDEK